MLSKKQKEELINLDINSIGFTSSMPKYKIPDASLSPRVARDIIRDELNLDGNPLLNLASFVTSRLEEEGMELMIENMNKNYVDQEEYPQTTEIQNRCVNMLADLYHAPDVGAATGTATIGSSEAIHLAGLAFKWKWKKYREGKGLSTDKPNIVFGQNVQVCWEKFARYFEVEPRYVPLSNDRFIIDVDQAMALVDENTIAVVGILGSTMSGEFEPIAALNDALLKINQENYWDVPIHVDAASGGFVAPFAYPKLEWDFRLPLVKSINVSGHKYGLVLPGLGWIIWRDKEQLPDDLIFHVNYLGNDEPTFNLNFSKNANNIIAQYYNFLRLGKDGYRQIMEKLLKIADFVGERVRQLGFELISQKNALPVVVFKLNDSAQFSVFDISDKLRERGWIVPAYTMPPNAEKIAVLRVVLREGFTQDLAEMLINDIAACMVYFREHVVLKRKHPKHHLKRTHVQVC